MGFEALLSVADRIAVGDLGKSVSYTPKAGPTTHPIGIFDAAYQGVDAGDRVRVSSAHPAIFFRLIDLPVDPEVDDPTLVINGTSYDVAEVHRDGLGGVLLLLQKVG